MSSEPTRLDPAIEALLERIDAPSRRAFLLGLGALWLTGCGQTVGGTGRLPGPAWDAYSPELDLPQDQHVASAPPPKASPAGVMPRTSWARGNASTSKMNRMSPVRWITVHHDAEFSSATSTSAVKSRIEAIRRYHMNNRGWGDIGYHYVVDRAGRVWDARSDRYQGAHVGDHNPGNIGVVCLGHFDEQRPTDAQVNALVGHIRKLRSTYRVSASNVKTHQEWAPTVCPGRNLQAFMVGARRKGLV